jgi:alkylation response protein AidB-like acyl-CoA dehydrogenase
MDVVGAGAVTGEHPEWMQHYLTSRLASVYGGTLQIQRNTLAERALGLPRAGRAERRS